ncbi:RING-H2 finger protein [Melia azedarach]|uniref:RING-H2 finger protein n=2 Tax=Melia azedarach TaxID=155640 RepID=A0ACC1XW39_MELAZ|nr:RING-H2 finger protein [Melia azedarach]KAJ4715396.1 RING-H2 finger protein [Melia azedarach]
MSTRYFSSTQPVEDFLGKFHSRKLLLHNPLNLQPVAAASPPGSIDNGFNSNVLMALAVLLFALICSLGMNSLIRWALIRCSRFVASESNVNSSTPIVKTGIKKKALKTFPVVNYSAELNLPGLDTECVICLSEFVPDEPVRLLPKCNHGFHVVCIDKWLRSHSSCPKCRHCVIETCEKICSQASSSSGPSVTLPETVVSIRPLEPEGTIRNFDGIS